MLPTKDFSQLVGGVCLEGDSSSGFTGGKVMEGWLDEALPEGRGHVLLTRPRRVEGKVGGGSHLCKLKKAALLVYCSDAKRLEGVHETSKPKLTCSGRCSSSHRD